MKNAKFDSDYIVIIGDNAGLFDVYACNTSNEMYSILTQYLQTELSKVMDNIEQFSPTHIIEYAYDLLETEIITDQGELVDAYASFFSSDCWFKVIDASGQVWFEYSWD